MSNRYNLSADNHSASDGVVIQITVTYDDSDDKVMVDVGRRNDVIDERLLQRLSHQIEHAIRKTSKLYDDEMRFIELLSGLVPDDDTCACGKGTCGKK